MCNNMCINSEKKKMSKQIENYNNMSHEIQSVIRKAKTDERLIFGLSSAASLLENNPDDVVLCILPGVKQGDVTTHMQIVLLQAFCYENCIPVLQVDNSKLLAQMCGMSISHFVKHPSEFFCAIIIRPENTGYQKDEDPSMSSSEKALIDNYEKNLSFHPQPIIHLSPPVS